MTPPGGQETFVSLVVASWSLTIRGGHLVTPPGGQDSTWLNMGWSRNICFLTIRGGHLVTPPGGQESWFFSFVLFFFVFFFVFFCLRCVWLNT